MTGCDAAKASVTVVIAPSNPAPSELHVSESADARTCIDYLLSAWSGGNGDTLRFQGKALATPKGTQGTPSSLALSYNVCQ